MSKSGALNPSFWRLCLISAETAGGDLQLEPGWWVLGFPTAPGPGTDPAANVVDDPAGAVAGVQVHVSAEVTAAESASGNAQSVGLQERIAREVSRAMFQLERRIHRPDSSSPI